MKKNYLFPHWFKVMGWVLSIAAVVAYLCIRDLEFKMPALSFDVLLLEDDDEGSYSFFRLANTNILSIAMPVLTSLIWATYVTAALFIVATLLIYGITYIYVPYLVFFVFLILFIIKFRIEVHRFNKGGAQ